MASSFDDQGKYMTPDEFMAFCEPYHHRGERPPVGKARIVGGSGTIWDPYLIDRDQIEIAP